MSEVSIDFEKSDDISRFEVLLGAQDFINYFTYFWEIFEEWSKVPNSELLLNYYTDDMEEVEYALTGWTISEVYQYLRDESPAGTIVPTEANEEIPERTDSPPDVHLIFSR